MSVQWILTFLSFSLYIYIYIYIYHLSIYRSIDLSIYRSIDLPIYIRLSRSLSLSSPRPMLLPKHTRTSAGVTKRQWTYSETTEGFNRGREFARSRSPIKARSRSRSMCAGRSQKEGSIGVSMSGRPQRGSRPSTGAARLESCTRKYFRLTTSKLTPSVPRFWLVPSQS